MAKEEEQKEAPTEEPTVKKKSNTPKIVMVVIIGLLIIYVAATRLLGIAGQKVAEKAIEEAIEQEGGPVTDVDISGNGEKIVIETEEGTFTAGKQELPDNFPSDLPVYSGAAIASTASGPEGLAVTLTTQDSAKEVSTFYKNELADNGWEITQTVTLENATVYGFQKGSIEGTVAITESEEGTSITISLDLGSE